MLINAELGFAPRTSVEAAAMETVRTAAAIYPLESLRPDRADRLVDRGILR